jgi:PAS domain S-box-containing protein
MSEKFMTEQRMKRLIQALKGYVYAVKIENGAAVETYHGEGCAEITGYTSEDHANDPELWFRMVHEDDREAVKTHVQKALAGEEQPPLEHRIIHRDGSLRWVKNTIVLNKDEHGRLLSYDGLITNISIRKRAEEELRASEQRYKRLIGSVTDYIYTVRLENGVAVETTHGPGCVAVTGYSPEEFAADKELWYRMVHEEDRKTVAERANRALHGEAVPTLKHRIIHKNGAVRWVRNTIVFRKDANGLVTSYDGLVSDFTERKKAEEINEIQRQQLIQADKLASLGTLVAGMAHEINNPNNYILLNAKFLSRGWREVKPILEAYAASHGDFIVAGLPYSQTYDKISQLFAGLIDGSKRIQKIVHSLKDFSRDDRVGAKEWIDVNEVIEAALTIVQPLIKKSTDNFCFCAGQEIPKILGNSQQLAQVVINLMTNSCQALQDKAARLCIETSYHAASKNVIVRVKDDGVGITKQDLKHIFDPFFTTKRDSGGTGLGLAISYRIVKDHGGELTLESQPGEGTVATIRLPVTKG